MFKFKCEKQYTHEGVELRHQKKYWGIKNVVKESEVTFGLQKRRDWHSLCWDCVGLPWSIILIPWAAETQPGLRYGQQMHVPDRQIQDWV